MQAVILAGGKGSRLHPITTNRSKAMLPVLGRPVVERVMEDLAACGVDDFILVVNPEDRRITQHFRDEARLEAEVRFAYQPRRLGMADALRWAAPLIEGEFILSACDNLTSPGHIANLLSAWVKTPRPEAVLTLMRMPLEKLSSAGVVTLEGERVVGIIEKPAPGKAPSDIASLPLYIFSPAILELLDEVHLSPRGEYELQDAIQMLIERGWLARGVFTESRLTLTSPADLLAINHHYLTHGENQAQIQPHSVGPNTRLVTPLYIEAGVKIGANCVIGPNVYIERGCQIGEGAALSNCILLREASVPAGTQISDQVVS